MPTPSRTSEVALAAVSASTVRETSSMLPVTEAAMAAFDYGTVAQLFPTRSEACLEVDAEIFDRDAIRRLYDSNDYPLARRAAPVPALEVEMNRQSSRRYR